ncbi:MAG: glycosyltransferase family 39 protein [Brachymonas sp.]|nr:glycosyltransferase family 39 protein [Brachymonas sp.]
MLKSASHFGQRLLARHPVGFPLLLLAVWLLLTLSWRPLAMPDEGRYASVALEMAQSGDWTVPLINGLPFFHKPPLFYWITAAAMKTVGNMVAASRMASALGAWMMGAGMFMFLRRHATLRMAQWSLLVLATLPLYFGAAQYVNLDMLVAGLISVTILAAVHAVLQEAQGLPYRAWVWFAYVLAALGLLAKGLIGIVLPGGVLVFWLLWMRHWRGLWVLVSLPGLILLLAVGLPWFLLMEQRYPGFLHYFFVYQHFQRFAETGFNNQMPFWFYVPVLLVLCLPWTWRGAQALWRQRQQVASVNDWFQPAPLHDKTALMRLCLVWLLLILMFFSLPQSKLVGYILPVLPACAMLLTMGITGVVAKPVADASPSFLPKNPLRTAFLSGAFCVISIVGIALFKPAPGLDAASSMTSQFQREDQLVMLDEFDPDTTYYLQTSRPAWVVASFDDKTQMRKDTWRKELWDAGQFNPALATQTLLTFKQLRPRVCNALQQNITLWIQGDAANMIRLYPFLGTQQPFWQRATRKNVHTVWRLGGRSALSSAGCEWKE